MPGPIITLTSEEDDLHHNSTAAAAAAAAAAAHQKNPSSKPILELSVAPNGRPYRSQVPSNIVVPGSDNDNNSNNDDDFYRQFSTSGTPSAPNGAAAPSSASAIPGSLGSSTDLPEVITEEDEETPSEGEPLTPSDSSSNIFQHHQQTRPSSPVGTNPCDSNNNVNSTSSSRNDVSGTSASSSNAQLANNNNNNGVSNVLRRTRPKPSAIHISAPSSDQNQRDERDNSLTSPLPPTTPVTATRSPRSSSQFFSNPFSSSASMLRQPSSASKPSRHTSFRSFFRRNSSALSNGHSEDLPGGRQAKPQKQQQQQPQQQKEQPRQAQSQSGTGAGASAGATAAAAAAPASVANGIPVGPSPASSVVAESAVSGTGSSGSVAGAGAGAGTGTSPTESKFRFSLKRRPSPPTYADNNSSSNGSNDNSNNHNNKSNSNNTSTGKADTNTNTDTSTAGSANNNNSDNSRKNSMQGKRITSGSRGGTWPLLSPDPTQQSQPLQPSQPQQPLSPSPASTGHGYTLNGRPVDDEQSARVKRHSHSHPNGHHGHLGHLKERSKILFGNLPKPLEHRMRSPSVSEAHNQPPRPGFSIPAAAGVGLKARRMSASLPDDFDVDTCELDDEYVSASKLPGKRGKALGKGATATVKVMARRGYKKSEFLYAVKEFRKCGQHEDKQEYIKKVKSEYSIAASLHHPNIVATYNLCTHNGRFNHVMEMCQYGELFTLVQKNYLGIQDNLCFFKQVVRGVGYLHANGIAHRDIKLENLLLNEEGHVKISDFGVSEVFCGIHPGLREAHGECGIGMKEVHLCQPGICGSMPYISPEVLAKKHDYDPRALDVWSCAIVMITLCCRGNPWQAAEPSDPNYMHFVAAWDKFYQAHPDGQITDFAMPKCGPIFSLISQFYSPGLRRLLLSMLHPNPEMRATIPDVLNDKYFKTIECCSPESNEDEAVTIDAAGRGSTRRAGKMAVQKVHHHAPPERKILPQHRFDMGDGYS